MNINKPRRVVAQASCLCVSKVADLTLSPVKLNPQNRAGNLRVPL